MEVKKSRLDYLPAILTLCAALISSVFTIIYRYDMTMSMIIILLSAVIFYIIGSVVKWIFISYLTIDTSEEVASENAETQEEAATEEDNDDSGKEEA